MENAKRGHRAARYGAATAAVGLALGGRLAVQPLLGYEAPYIFFTIAALLTTWVAGAGPGILAVMLGFLCGDYFLTPPVHNFGPYSLREQASIADFMLGTAVGIILLALLRRSQARLKVTAEELAAEIEVRKCAERELKGRKNQLETRVAETTKSLRQSVTSMEELMYSMVHNLRAPSRAMEGLAHVIADTCQSNIHPSAGHLLDRLSAAARKNDSVIRDLLEYGRVSHIDLNLRPLSIKEILLEAMNDLDREIASTGGHIVVERPVANLTSDKDALLIVLRELMGNALKFRSESRTPVVRIRTEQRADGVKIFVEDNGTGIDEAYVTKLFRPFEKLALESDGNGIGLAIVSKLVDRLGGSIEVRSRLGKGTAFAVELPITKEEGRQMNSGRLEPLLGAK